jgi:catechol 2,3-dioxygenase-like lactoylglutathione lyase family enzyme
VPLIHHLALTAADLPRSLPFYDGLLAFFGYARTLSTPHIAAWEGPDFELLLYQAKDELRARRHALYQPGFHHLALRARDRAQVEAVHDWLAREGWTVLDAPRAYPDYPGDYYAVFFEDPDGIKLEVMVS